MQDTAQSKLQVVNSLLSLKQDEKETHLDYKSRLEQMFSKVDDMKITFKDIMLAKFLSGLLPKYADFKTSTVLLRADSSTLDEIAALLTSHITSKDIEDQNISANVGVHRSFSSGSSHNKPVDITSLASSIDKLTKRFVDKKNGKRGSWKRWSRLW